MLPSSTVENYLKAIHQGQSSLERDQRLVPMGQVATALGVTPGTATTMVKALAESGLARRAADCEPEYIDWELSIGADGEGFYFQPDAGPTTVDVTTAPDGTRTLVVTMSLLGSAGELRASAEMVVPATAAVS